MRRLNFIIFFSIALTVYGLINFYVFLRGWEAMSAYPAARLYCLVVGLFVALAFIAGRFLERVRITWFSTSLVWIGSFWLAAMTYFLLGILAIDILKISNSIVPWFPSYISANLTASKEVTGLLLLVGVVVMVIAGHVNAIHPRIKTLNLHVAKGAGNVTALNIVVASDIHLGTIISKSRLERIVELVNSLDPDIVLLPGDVFDEDIGPVIKENLGETLRSIKSKFGVYAVTGNHEYIGGEEAACRYLEQHGIKVLRDSSVRINDCCYVVGREDISIRQFGGKQRKSLDDLLRDVDSQLPVILLDHQPFHLEDAEHHGIDLQLSGHTHHGQLWPFNYISAKIFEVSWGYKKKGSTHIYVSCGVGSWGPPVRTGNTPEIVNIRLTFGGPQISLG